VFLESFNSLKTKKIRIFNKDTANWASGLNATPITIPWAEVYTAAQRGVIDGATGSLGTVYDSKWYEIFKYITVMDSWLSIDGINVNLDAWKELPKEYQNIVMQTAAKWQKSFWLKRETDNFKKNVLAQQNYGCKVTHLDPEFRKKISKMCEEKIWPSWIERTGQPDKAKGILKDIAERRTEFEKWPKDKQNQWLVEHGYPEQVLDF
jgi:TRAP-type C4-dicarboxylate transport system substrate-binding protein